MTSIFRLFILITVLTPCYCAFAAHLDLQKDANGWTIFTPSTDTRVVYVASVASGGNDSTCADYAYNDAKIGSDPFNPVGAIVPCATFATAANKTRYDAPDWILVKRGDVFLERISDKNKSGRSLTEPSLIGAYGSSGASPVFKSGSEAGIMFTNNRSYFALSGIDFYAHTRDPGSPDFTGIEGSFGMLFLGGTQYTSGGLLVEGCKFRFFDNNGMIDFANNGGGITVRRSLFLDAYSADSSPTGKSQGLLVSNVGDGIILEENIFDHNGWYSKAGSGGIGQANMFNHSFYIGDSRTATVRNNISLRPSSINIKFAAYGGAGSVGPFEVTNNLIVDGEVGITMAGANEPVAYRVLGATITGNVIANLNRSRIRGQDLAWGIDLLDLDGGLVDSNYIINANSGNSKAIGHQGTSRNVSITNNVVYYFRNVSSVFYLDNSFGSNVQNMTFSNNKLQIPQDSGHTIYTQYDTSGKWSFTNNKYYSDRADGTQYSLVGSDKTFSQWKTATGDNSTFEQVTFPDSTRSIETYMQSIGETGTIDAFITKCRTQDRYNWNTAYTAPIVNAWIKAGFDNSNTYIRIKKYGKIFREVR